MENIKKIDNAGRLVLGKKFANSYVSIDSSRPNEINIRLVDVISKSENDRITTLTPESFALLIDHMEKPQEETEAFLEARKRYQKLKKE